MILILCFIAFQLSVITIMLAGIGSNLQKIANKDKP